MTRYRGVLTFHSETGTEGGFWAFQDAEYMHGETESCPWGWKSCPGMRSYWHNGIAPVRLSHWLYEGLHVLNDGYQLTIYRPDSADIAWEGEIHLRQHPPFTEDAHGYWVHSDQIGVERADWARMFFEEWPAELTIDDEKLTIDENE